MSIIQIDTPRWALPLLEQSRFKAAWGGRGSGKSHFFGEYIIENHIADKDQSTVCVREVQKSLDQSVKRLLEQKIEKMNAGWYFQVQDSKIKSSSGSGLITFQGMQNHTADSVKSLEGYHRAWVEEAQTLSQYSLDLLRPTIRMPESEILFSWNPRYKTDPVDKFFRKNPPKDAIIVNVNWQDNPWFPEVLRREMEHDFATDEDKAEHIWNGAYGNAQGSILGKWVSKAIRESRISPDVSFDPGGAPIEISSDLGFRDTASWWYWQRCLGGYRVLKYDGDTGLDADDWIPRIQQAIEEMGFGKIGKVWLPHDARAKTFQSKHTTIEKFLSAFGHDKVAIVPISKKIDQISAARTVIDKCEFNYSHCEDGIDGLAAWEYEYNEETGIFSREPLHNWASHPADAFAYGCQVMQFQDPPKPSEDGTLRGVTVGDNSVTLEEMWQTAPKRSDRL